MVWHGIYVRIFPNIVSEELFGFERLESNAKIYARKKSARKRKHEFGSNSVDMERTWILNDLNGWPFYIYIGLLERNIW